MNTTRTKLRAACTAVATLGIVAASAGAADALTLSQASGTIVAGNSVACGLNEGPQYGRFFDIQAEKGITTPFELTSVSFGVESADPGPFLDTLSMTVQVRAVGKGGTGWIFAPLLGSATVDLDAAANGTVITVPMSATLQNPLNQDLAVVVIAPGLADGFEASFAIGSNAEPETAEGYILGCGHHDFPVPASTVKPGMHLVISADGEAEKVQDADGDGVADGDDQCPDLAGSASNAGCPVPDRVVSGFHQPVDQGMPNKAQAGSTVPFKFTVTDGDGNPVTDLTADDVATLKGPLGSCVGEGGDQIEETVAGALGGKLINQGGGLYQYNWKTEKAWKGKCVTLGIQVTDAEPQKARFDFAK